MALVVPDPTNPDFSERKTLVRDLANEKLLTGCVKKVCKIGDDKIIYLNIQLTHFFLSNRRKELEKEAVQGILDAARGRFSCQCFLHHQIIHAVCAWCGRACICVQFSAFLSSVNHEEFPKYEVHSSVSVSMGFCAKASDQCKEGFVWSDQKMSFSGMDQQVEQHPFCLHPDMKLFA